MNTEQTTTEQKIDQLLAEIDQLLAATAYVDALDRTAALDDMSLAFDSIAYARWEEV